MLISLSYYLKNESKFMIVDYRNEIQQLPQGFSDYFVFKSSTRLIKILENSQNYRVVALENIDPSVLFKIK